MGGCIHERFALGVNGHNDRYFIQSYANNLKNQYGNAGTLQRKRLLWFGGQSAFYFGWITVATIANATALMVSIGYDGAPLTPQSWTILFNGSGYCHLFNHDLEKKHA